MNRDKILNIAIAFLITVLIFNFFTTKKDASTTLKTVVFKTVSTSYTLPTMPQLEIDNNLDKAITLNTCKNLVIRKDGAKIENINKSFPNFCTDISIPSKGITKLNLESLSTMFYVSGKYDFELNLPSTNLLTSFTVDEKSWFNSLISYLFFAPVYNLFVFVLSTLPNHSLGLSILIVTLIIRFIVLIPQHKMMVSSKKMQLIQPKIKALQEKYKGDQSKIGMELLELYKKEGVNPMGSCLPLFIQLPILIVLYWTITGITSTANYFYLYGPLAKFDISLIDSQFFGLNLIAQEWKSGLILAVILGVLQWIQIKLSLTFNSKKKDHGKVVIKEEKMDDPVSEFMPDPNMMNAFMLWGMPIMFAFSSFFFPSGVSIYWVIGTVFTIVQQIIVNRLSEKKELKTKDGNEIIINKKK